jgi:AMP-binding enzyme
VSACTGSPRRCAQGLQRHDRVAALCPNVPELLELHRAVPAAGGVLVAINVRLGAAEIRYILEHSGSQVLFVDRELEPVAREALVDVEVVRLGDEYEQLLASGDPAGVPTLLRDEEEPIAIEYTSGTTGRPKGVVYTYRGAYLNALGEVIEAELGHHPVYLWTLPIEDLDRQGAEDRAARAGVGGPAAADQLARHSSAAAPGDDPRQRINTSRRFSAARRCTSRGAVVTRSAFESGEVAGGRARVSDE